MIDNYGETSGYNQIAPGRSTPATNRGQAQPRQQAGLNSAILGGRPAGTTPFLGAIQTVGASPYQEAANRGGVTGNPNASAGLAGTATGNPNPSPYTVPGFVTASPFTSAVPRGMGMQQPQSRGGYTGPVLGPNGGEPLNMNPTSNPQRDPTTGIIIDPNAKAAADASKDGTSLDGLQMGTPEYVMAYFKSKGKSPYNNDPSYWVEKWNEWGKNDPDYWLERMSQADEFQGRPANFNWQAYYGGAANPMTSAILGQGSTNQSGSDYAAQIHKALMDNLAKTPLAAFAGQYQH